MHYKLATAIVESSSVWRHQPDIGGVLRVIVAAEDDDARSELRRIIQAEDGVRVIAESTSALDTVAKVDRLRPDIVFLDMQMEGTEGFDIAGNLDYLPEIVLTSSLHHHALRAYESGALDFLLKPISADRLKRTISRARRLLTPPRKIPGAWDVPFPAPIFKKKPTVSRLAVHKGKRVLLLNFKDIYYIKVESRLVFVFTGHDRYLVNRTIMELEELLRDEGFFQINRGTIINLDYLQEIIPWFSGTCRLRLANETELPLSRDRVSTLKATVGLPGTWSGK
jgi:DNA-binding LytR/AlgR family response regulator